MSDTTFDVIFLGSGPAGYVGALRAAQLGLRVAVVEKRPALGGTCLNVGCIPSKALLTSSEHYHFAQTRFAAHGLILGELGLDLKTMMRRKQDVVDRLGKGIAALFKKETVTRFLGTGTLVDAQTVGVASESGTQRLTARRAIVVATGSVPMDLPFLKPDGVRWLTSDHALALESVPASLTVIGAGAIGLELGSVWARLGSKVTVVEFLPRIAAFMDAELSSALQRSLEKQGLAFHLGAQVKSANVTETGVTLSVAQDDKTFSLESERVLVAVGRRPFHEGLGLERLGIKLTPKGRIQIDAHWQTSVPGVFAVGDVVEGPMLAHKAEEEGIALAEHLAGKGGHVNYDLIPSVVYTAPEAAAVGLTEEQAKEKGISIKKGKHPFLANGRALAADSSDGFVKVIADAKTDRLLGAHILHAQASELIAECVAVMEFGGSAEDIGRTVHAHPTLSEAIKEACLAASRQPVPA
jgi:dihydrolipoamide dehydrogenase